MPVRPFVRRASAVAACCAALSSSTVVASDLGEIVVTAPLRAQPVLELPASVTVLGPDVLGAAGAQHLEDVLALVPNLNWSGGSSRPRYLQLRGIGELEQYQGAPNPSVGFLLDDVDFSGLGMVATLFDLERIEVLRGPQGTRYGANALGGLVYARSREPEDTFGAEVQAGFGRFDARSFGASVTGPIAALDSAVRLAVHGYRSDGAYENRFLGRPTNARDERTARLRWRYAPDERLGVDVALLHARLDNGYDAFAIDNSRRTLSDRPGEDSQHATGASVRARWSGWHAGELTVIATHADSDSVHAYDGDWGNARSWAPYVYDFDYRADRDRRTRSLEMRLASPSGAPVGWLVGAYAQRLAETIAETSGGTLGYPPGDPAFDFGFTTSAALASRYRADSLAAFAQLDGEFAPSLAWSAGLRAERRRARYADATVTDGAPAGANSFDPRDSMAGGHASLTWRYAPNRSAYASLARGYKAGGFNLSGALPEARRRFAPESLWNLEVGWKAVLADGRLRIETAAFHMLRDDLQIRTGEQLVPGDPNTFVFYTGNAATGRNSGLEASVRWRATPAVELGLAAGALSTRFRDFAIDGEPVPDREQPHAPAWQAAADAIWRGAGGWHARVEATGTAAFRFDVPPNDTRSRPYVLVHARAGYETPRWSAVAYVRNAFDREYAVRGFFFGNEPPDFPNRLYVQLGAPREWGVQFGYRH
ncbi:MAG: TonB-dependent receptor [Steroidobacteraceae bacterium]|nr:TonB-dependent receptor [Steroidobacteraceae bacterium]